MVNTGNAEEEEEMVNTNSIFSILNVPISDMF